MGQALSSAAVEVAVVTGAGRGLGRAFAERLASRGLAVLATDVDGSAAEATAAALGDRAWSAVLDVRDTEACRRVAAEAAGRGHLKVWINNAGVLRTEDVEAHDDATVDLIVAVNLLGVINGTRAAVGAMGASGGRILNMGSMSSFSPAPGLAVYGATKHAVLAFSTSLEAELREAGRPVTVRCLCPDAVDTEMVRERAEGDAAALIFSAPSLLTADQVADRGVELLYSPALRAVMPAWRGATGRLLFTFPRAGIRLLPLFRKLGERNRERWRSETGAAER